MSRSTVGNKSGLKSPVKKWINFKGNTGTYSYWNGTENVSLDELRLVLMDTRSCITGWSDSANARIWSNTIKVVGSEELVVKTKGADIAKGLYADIKDSVKNAGGNFTLNVYALVKIENDYELCCLSLDKGGLKEWSDFLAANKLSAVYDNVLVCTKGDQQKKGAVKYYNPKFELAGLIEDDVVKNAMALDRDVLQPYFSGVSTEEKEENSDVEAPF